MLDKYKVLIGKRWRRCQYCVMNDFAKVRRFMSHKLLIAAFLTAALAACGQSGALYLPKDVPANSNQQESTQEESSKDGSSQTPASDETQSPVSEKQSSQPKE